MKREEEKEKKVRPATLPARGTRALTPPPQRVRAERERKRREGLVVSSSSEEEEEEEDSESSDWPGKEEAKAKAAAEAEAEAEQKKRADWERTKAQREEKQAKREALVRGRTGGEGNGGADTIRDARLAPSQEGAAALEAGGREGKEGAPSNPPRTRDSCTDLEAQERAKQEVKARQRTKREAEAQERAKREAEAQERAERRSRREAEVHSEPPAAVAVRTLRNGKSLFFDGMTIESDNEADDEAGNEADDEADDEAEAEAKAEQKKRAQNERNEARREANEAKRAKREALVRGRTGGEGNGGADDTRCAPSSIARGSSSA